MHAAISGNLNAVKYLVECGADVNTKDNIGMTALDIARVNENLEVMIYLKSLST